MLNETSSKRRYVRMRPSNIGDPVVADRPGIVTESSDTSIKLFHDFHGDGIQTPDEPTLAQLSGEDKTKPGPHLHFELDPLTLSLVQADCRYSGGSMPLVRPGKYVTRGQPIGFSVNVNPIADDA